MEKNSKVMSNNDEKSACTGFECGSKSVSNVASSFMLDYDQKIERMALLAVPSTETLIAFAYLYSYDTQVYREEIDIVSPMLHERLLQCDDLLLKSEILFALILMGEASTQLIDDISGQLKPLLSDRNISPRQRWVILRVISAVDYSSVATVVSEFDDVAYLDNFEVQDEQAHIAQLAFLVYAKEKHNATIDFQVILDIFNLIIIRLFDGVSPAEDWDLVDVADNARLRVPLDSLSLLYLTAIDRYIVVNNEKPLPCDDMFEYIISELERRLDSGDEASQFIMHIYDQTLRVAR
jgi:uncharacterized protein with PIN domain